MNVFAIVKQNADGIVTMIVTIGKEPREIAVSTADSSINHIEILKDTKENETFEIAGYMDEEPDPMFIITAILKKL